MPVASARSRAAGARAMERLKVTVPVCRRVGLVRRAMGALVYGERRQRGERGPAPQQPSPPRARALIRAAPGPGCPPPLLLLTTPTTGALTARRRRPPGARRPPPRRGPRRRSRRPRCSPRRTLQWWEGGVGLGRLALQEVCGEHVLHSWARGLGVAGYLVVRAPTTTGQPIRPRPRAPLTARAAKLRRRQAGRVADDGAVLARHRRRRQQRVPPHRHKHREGTLQQ